MIFVHKLSYQIQSFQEFMVVNGILDTFNFTKRHPHIGYAYLDDLSKEVKQYYIGIFLDTKEEKYAFMYGPLACSEYTECKSLTDFCNKMEEQRQANELTRVTSMIVDQAQEAFNMVIESFDNDIDEIQKFTTLMYNAYSIDSDEQHDNWFYNEWNKTCLDIQSQT